MSRITDGAVCQSVSRSVRQLLLVASLQPCCGHTSSVSILCHTRTCIQYAVHGTRLTSAVAQPCAVCQIAISYLSDNYVRTYVLGHTTVTNVACLARHAAHLQCTSVVSQCCSASSCHLSLHARDALPHMPCCPACPGAATGPRRCTAAHVGHCCKQYHLRAVVAASAHILTQI